MVLAIILGPVADEHFLRALVGLHGKSLWSILANRPSGGLLLLIVRFTFYDGIFRRR